MATRKRNEYLDSEGSDEEIDRGYDSDAAEEGRGAIGGHAIKRRKVQADSDIDSVGGLSDVDNDDGDDDGVLDAAPQELEDAPVANAPQDDSDDEPSQAKLTKPVTNLKPSTPKQVARAQKVARRSGVVYISRVPPFMKPHTLKHFLTPHAPSGLGRVFLTPEDAASAARRRKSGGNKKKSFTDGWVEFVSKGEAKAAVELLNGGIMGGKKGGFYHDDLWNMKYLKGFKWSHLTEQVANENAERAARLREEIRRTRKENLEFVKLVEEGKRTETEGRKEERRKAKGLGDGEGAKKRKQRTEREFKQRKVQGMESRGDSRSTSDATKVLSSIF